MFRKTFFILTMVTSLSFHSTPLEAANGRTKKDVASLLVLIDLSGSMAAHRMKMTKLAPLVEDAMKKTSCEFRVAIGSIQYKNFKPRHLKPWTEPGGDPWVTPDTFDGPQKIYDRIANPNDTVHPNNDGDQYPGIIKSDDEATYSSLVESIQYNWAALQDSEVIGTILLTDAVPAFEIYTPQTAADLIKTKVGNIPYLSALVVAEVNSGMMVQPKELYNSSTGESIPLCGPDHEGNQQPGFMINTSRWDSKNADAMNQFTDAIYGEQWDICEPEYDQKLKEFIDTVLAVGGCLPIS